MTVARRDFLRCAAGVAATPLLPRLAAAQAYPARPVKMIVGFPAGNAPDIVARLIGQWLSEQIGQPVIVENRPGAASNIGAEAVVRSPPDGYTILMTVLTNVFNTTLYPNLNFNFVSDIQHVAGVANAPFVIVSPPSFPAKNIPEFVAYAKANPGKVNFASSGKGSASHIFAELFKTLAGVDLVHVAYRSSYMPDLLSGQVQILVAPIPQAAALIREGKLRALGVTTAKRLVSLPDTPTVGEAVPGYEAIGWYGLGVPKTTPPEIAERINEATGKALADPKLQARLADLGVEAMPMSRDTFSKFVNGEADKWTKVIRSAGVSLD